MSQATTSQIIAGRYKVAARLGSGGMGDVYRAWDPNLQRSVAIKVLPEKLATNPGFVQRFRAEAQAAAKLSHPNVVQVYDWGSADGSYFMVMEYVRGRTLREVLATRGRLEPAQAAAVVGQLLSALEAAHASGLVHRDVKPENVLVTPSGEIKVTDFGIARLAEGAVTSRDFLGTASYASPEQIQGDAVDGRSDLYAAGCVLYELVCGAPPFEGSVAHVLHEHLTASVPPPSVECLPAAPLDAAVAKATAIDPAQRYPSAAAMREALAAAAQSLPEAPGLPELAAEVTSVVAGPQEETMMAPLPKRHRWRWPVAVAGFLILLLVAGGVLLRPVPRVAGEQASDALASLRRAGLHVSSRQEFSDTVNKGQVISASQPFQIGPLGLRGSAVRLVVSKGVDLRQVPDVTGHDVTSSVQAIKSAGLFPAVTMTYNSTTQKGNVISQDPPPEAARVGTVVNLTESLGPEMVTMPLVSGTVVAAAAATLANVGLTAVQQGMNSDTIPTGTVLDQTPAPATSIPKHSTVTLTVSEGPAPFPLPSVANGSTTCAAAQAQLQALGLVVAVSSGNGSNTCAGNQVLFQLPAAGATVHKGDTVKLYVP